MIILINNIATDIPCITETVTEELNGIYEYEATMPAYEASADKIEPNMIVHASNGVSTQAFRIYDVKRDIEGICEVKAQHISYDLAKIPVAPFTATGVSNALAAVSSNSMVTNPFTFTTDLTNTTSEIAFTYPLSARQILGGVEGSFLDRFHCEFEFDNYNVKVLSQRGEARDVTVNYGESMTDFTQEINGENYYTGVLVFAIVDDVTYQSDIYNLVQSSRPFIAIIDVSDRYEEGDTPTTSELNAIAQQYATSNHISTLKTTTDVGYIDLANTDQYAGLEYVQPVHIGDTIHVNFQPLGISINARAYAYTYNCLLQKYDSIKIGDAKANLYSTISSMTGSAYAGAGGETTQKNVYYGTSSTAAGTQDKIVNTIDGDFTLDTGNILTVTFTNANTYTSARLNVDNTGAHSIKLVDGYDVEDIWQAGETVTFVYNGSDFLLVESGIASTSKYGVTKLSSAIDSTAQNLAATPYAVKLAYDHVPSTYAGSTTAGGTANKTMAIPFGKVDSSSTSTAFTATVDGISSLSDGVCMFLMNGAVTSASGFTININSLGAKPVYSTMGASSRITTTFNVNYTMLFVYNSQRINGGCWDMYYGYNSDTTTARGNNDYYFRAYAGEDIYRYKFVMQGADNRMYPITVTNQASATQVAKVPTTVGLRPWNIWYYNSTSTASAGSAIGAQTLLPSIYGTTAVYNFNTSTGVYRMIYLRGTYNKTTDMFTLYNDGSSPCTSYYSFVPTNTANITLSNYFVSGYYYLLLGGTYSTTNYFSLFNVNPFYYFDGTNLIPVTNMVSSGTVTDVRVSNASIVNGSGIANIPLANGSNWGLVNVSGATEPGSSYATIERTASPGTYTYTVPTLNLNGKVLPSYLPDATYTSKGVVQLSEWVGSISDNIDEAGGEGYDSTAGGVVRTVTTSGGNFSLTSGNRCLISDCDFWGWSNNYPHFLNIDSTGAIELRYSGGEQVRSSRYEALVSGTIEVVYNGTYFLIVNGYAFKKPTYYASATDYGMVKFAYVNEATSKYISITGSDYTARYAPALSSTSDTILAKYLPSATSSVKGAVIVDSAMDSTSTNPVQNSVVKAYIEAYGTAITTTEIDTITA